MTSIEEALRSGAVRGVLADWSALPNDLYVTEVRTNDGIVFDATLCSVPMAIGPEVRYSRADTKRCEHCDGTGDVHSIGGEWRGRCTCPAGAALSAAPDHTPALLALIEERDRLMGERDEARERLDPTAYAIELGRKLATLNTRTEAAEARALAAEAECDALRALICRIGPHIDAIVCYANTMGEHEPNRIAHEVRAVCSGPSQDEVVGQKIAAQMIAKIDAAVARSGAGYGWLIELKGGVPSWAVVNPEDYDEHWTTDSTRALRFARREDAQSYIDHIGWTEAFPSEHIWDDGERHDQ